MRRADRIGARAALVFGEDEAASGKGIIKDLGNGAQIEVELTGEAVALTLADLGDSGA